jgi:Vitamin B12 dependent methionine synthase, activation domain
MTPEGPGSDRESLYNMKTRLVGSAAGGSAAATTSRATPSRPDLAFQRQLFEVLHPQDIGVELTEGDMMDPEASVSALVFHHPTRGTAGSEAAASAYLVTSSYSTKNVRVTLPFLDPSGCSILNTSFWLLVTAAVIFTKALISFG